MLNWQTSLVVICTGNKKNSLKACDHHFYCSAVFKTVLYMLVVAAVIIKLAYRSVNCKDSLVEGRVKITCN